MKRSMMICSVVILASVVALVSHKTDGQDNVAEGGDKPASLDSDTNFRGKTGLLAMKVFVKKARQGEDASVRTFGIEVARDEDLGLLLTGSEDGHVSVVERPRFAMVSKAMTNRTDCVRYDVYTGDSVISTGATTWTKIVDETPPPRGFYEVQIAGPYTAGDNHDLRVVNRIERNTGRSWYLYNDKWQPYHEPMDEAAE